MARVGAIPVDLVSSISKVVQRKNNVMCRKTMPLVFMVSMSWVIDNLSQPPRPDVGGWDLKTHFITK